MDGGAATFKIEAVQTVVERSELILTTKTFQLCVQSYKADFQRQYPQPH